MHAKDTCLNKQVLVGQLHRSMCPLHWSVSSKYYSLTGLLPQETAPLWTQQTGKKAKASFLWGKGACLQVPHTVLQVLVLQQQQVNPLFEVAAFRPLQRQA